MKRHCDLFLTALGERLSTLGFPPKIIRKTLFFQQSTAAGMVGIHVNPIYRGDSIDFSLSCGVSVTSVQALLVHTELYEWDGGLTWSFGGLLKQLRRMAGTLPKEPNIRFDPDGRYHVDEEAYLKHLARYGTDDGVVNLDYSSEDIARQADETFSYVLQVGWPFLQRHGMTEEAVLEFSVADTKLSHFVYLAPRRELTALILARKLGRMELTPDIVEKARERFAEFSRLGNPRTSAQFERIGRQLDLL